MSQDWVRTHKTPAYSDKAFIYKQRYSTIREKEYNTKHAVTKK